MVIGWSLDESMTCNTIQTSLVAVAKGMQGNLEKL